MAKSGFYDVTEEDSRSWAADQATRATAINEAAVANAAAIQAATRAASPVTAIDVVPATAEIDLSDGETVQLSVTTTPASQGVSVTWGTSHPSRATVDANGLVTPVGIGAATITATCVHSGAITDTAVVTVVA